MSKRPNTQNPAYPSTLPCATCGALFRVRGFNHKYCRSCKAKATAPREVIIWNAAFDYFWSQNKLNKLGERTDEPRVKPKDWYQKTKEFQEQNF